MDDDTFAAAMGEVTPISQQKTHIIPSRKKPKPHEILAQREQYQQPSTRTPLFPQQRTALDDDKEPWTLRANGVSPVVMRRLAAGQPPVVMTLDLHGEYREPALRQLQQAIVQAYQEGKRVLRVIHGRGMHSSDKPVLKQAVYHDLQYGVCATHVLAAIPEVGSRGGACLVLLRRKK